MSDSAASTNYCSAADGDTSRYAHACSNPHVALNSHWRCSSIEENTIVVVPSYIMIEVTYVRVRPNLNSISDFNPVSAVDDGVSVYVDIGADSQDPRLPVQGSQP